MRPVAFPPDDIVTLFREHKVLTKQEVLDACGCKTMTLWKALHDYGYFTSYNFNAKYYTLRDVPTFDELGLWAYRKVRFSRWGTLSQTLTELIERSDTGYVASELTSLLAVEVAPELSRLHGLGRIPRQKVGPRFVYVASDERVRSAQVSARQETLEQALEEARLPRPEVIIAVLVDLIQHPGARAPAVARRLKRRKIPLAEKDVQAIFTRYNLAGKKGP